MSFVTTCQDLCVIFFKTIIIKHLIPNYINTINGIYPSVFFLSAHSNTIMSSSLAKTILPALPCQALFCSPRTDFLWIQHKAHSVVLQYFSVFRWLGQLDLHHFFNFFLTQLFFCWGGVTFMSYLYYYHYLYNHR